MRIGDRSGRAYVTVSYRRNEASAGKNRSRPGRKLTEPRCDTRGSSSSCEGSARELRKLRSRVRLIAFIPRPRLIAGRSFLAPALNSGLVRRRSRLEVASGEKLRFPAIIFSGLLPFSRRGKRLFYFGVCCNSARLLVVDSVTRTA